MLPLAFFIGKVYNIMAQIIFSIPDDKIQGVRNAFADAYSYQATIANPDFDPQLPEDPITNPSTIDNPETKHQFFKRKVREYVREVTKAYQAKTAASSARQTAIDNFDLDVTDG